MAGKDDLDKCFGDLASERKSSSLQRSRATAIFLILLLAIVPLVAMVTFLAIENVEMRANRYGDFDGRYFSLLSYKTENGNATKFANVSIPYQTYFGFRLNRGHPSHDVDSPLQALNILESYIVVDQTVTGLATEVRANCANQSDAEEVTNALLSIVQDWGENYSSIRYYGEVVDQARYPVETLAEQSGDCEDQAILFLALAKSIGYEGVFFLTIDHAFAGIRLPSAPTRNNQANATGVEIGGKVYYTCECTMLGWRVGDIQPDLLSKTIYARVIS